MENIKLNKQTNKKIIYMFVGTLFFLNFLSGVFLTKDDLGLIALLGYYLFGTSSPLFEIVVFLSKASIFIAIVMFVITYQLGKKRTGGAIDKQAS